MINSLNIPTDFGPDSGGRLKVHNNIFQLK